MARKKSVEKTIEDHKQLLKTDPQYSLIVDADNLYNWTEVQKKFLEYYIQTKNFKQSCFIAKYPEDEATLFILSYEAQKEIRRINMAMTQLQFQNKMANLDEIGGYLTSLLQGYSTIDETLTKQDKLQIVDLLLKVHKTKIDAVKDPQTIITRDLNVDFSNLSIKTLRTLLDNYDSKDIDIISNNNLSPEEISNLKSQNQEILNIINKLK